MYNERFNSNNGSCVIDLLGIVASENIGYIICAHLKLGEELGIVMGKAACI